jgi:hypothetical protein
MRLLLREGSKGYSLSINEVLSSNGVTKTALRAELSLQER